MNRTPVVSEEQRAEYGAPTTEVEKKQKKAPPIYGKKPAAKPLSPEAEASYTAKYNAKK